MGQGLRPDKHYAIQDEPPPANTDHVKRKFPDIPYASLSQAQKLDIYLLDEQIRKRNIETAGLRECAREKRDKGG